MRILLLLSALVLIVAGCVPKIDLMAEADSWDISVVPAKVVEAEGAGQSTEGKDEPELVITVPPSDKPTHVEVRKVKRSIIDKVLTNKPEHNIRSDNKEVRANQPKKTLWWKYLVLIIVGLMFLSALIAAIARKVTNFSPLGFVKKILKRG